jgi:hypothetical protein
MAVMTRLPQSDNRNLVATSGSTSDYLKARIRHLLGQADLESHPKRRFQILESARELSFRLRNRKGESIWIPVGFAAVMCLLLVFAARRDSAHDFIYSSPSDRFQVLIRRDSYHYRFNHIRSMDSGLIHSELEMEAVFCPSYEPQLSAGQTITWLHYADFGKCWDIQPKGYGYRIERDGAGKPTLADNCFVNASDVTECKPNFTEVVFSKGE